MTGTSPLAYRHVEQCMGTTFSFDVRLDGAPDRTVAATAVGQAVQRLHHINEVFSTYLPDSEIRQVRDGRLPLQHCSHELLTVLRACEYFTRATGGAFDAYASGELDPSGYVKGWAVQEASDILTAAGLNRHMVNGGGDVQCSGQPTPWSVWRVGIANPLQAGSLIGTVDGGSGDGRTLAVATSGTMERGRHLIDPRTRRPVKSEDGPELVAVTVVGVDLSVVDVYATAAFVAGPDSAADLLRPPGCSGLLLFQDGTVRTLAS